MKDLLFLLRALVLTVIAILILQVKVGGEETLEQRSEAWIRTSGFVDYLQEVADGAVVVIYRAYDQVGAFIDSKLGSVPFMSSMSNNNVETKKYEKPGQRHLNMRLERSKEFLKETAANAKNLLEEKVETFQDRYLEEEFPLEEE